MLCFWLEVDGATSFRAGWVSNESRFRTATRTPDKSPAHVGIARSRGQESECMPETLLAVAHRFLVRIIVLADTFWKASFYTFICIGDLAFAGPFMSSWSRPSKASVGFRCVRMACTSQLSGVRGRISDRGTEKTKLPTPRPSAAGFLANRCPAQCIGGTVVACCGKLPFEE